MFKLINKNLLFLLCFIHVEKKKIRKIKKSMFKYMYRYYIFEDDFLNIYKFFIQNYYTLYKNKLF
jgi:hemerythrin